MEVIALLLSMTTSPPTVARAPKPLIRDESLVLPRTRMPVPTLVSAFRPVDIRHRAVWRRCRCFLANGLQRGEAVDVLQLAVAVDLEVVADAS